jgi:hypothetical protein
MEHTANFIPISFVPGGPFIGLPILAEDKDWPKTGAWGLRPYRLF